MPLQKYTPINKENIPGLKFPKEDVLNDGYSRLLRRYHLDRAMLVGNTHKGKVRIVFHTEDGTTHQVETTVWASSEDHVVLKGGITLPVISVEEVELF